MRRVIDRLRSDRRLLATAGAVVALVSVVARLAKVEVSGDSMAPTLQPGDRLLVLRRGGPWRGPRPGDLVTVPDPRAPSRTIVKRLGRATPLGADLRGDNPHASTDSRTFGTVPIDRLVGRAVYRYAPRERAGRLPGRSSGDVSRGVRRPTRPRPPRRPRRRP